MELLWATWVLLAISAHCLEDGGGLCLACMHLCLVLVSSTWDGHHALYALTSPISGLDVYGGLVSVWDLVLKTK